MSGIDIAVVGATGLIGAAILAQLAEERVGIGQVHALASHDSAGKRVEFAGHHLKVAALDEFDFSMVRLAIFAVPEAVSREYVPQAVQAGCRVVDHSAAFRQDPAAALVHPVIAPSAIGPGGPAILSLPGSAAAQLAELLAPIQGAAGLERVSASVLLPVSCFGESGMRELARQSADLLNVHPIKPRLLTRQCAFNLIPGAGDSAEDPDRIEAEVRRLLGMPELEIGVQCGVAPVFYGCTQMVQVTTFDPLGTEDLDALYPEADGYTLPPREGDEALATPVSHAAGSVQLFIEPARQLINPCKTLQFWTVADNIQKNTARNSVQTMKILVKHA